MFKQSVWEIIVWTDGRWHVHERPTKASARAFQYQLMMMGVRVAALHRRRTA